MEIRLKKNVATYIEFPMLDSTALESYLTGATVADTAYYKDGAGAWTSLAITDTVSEISTIGVYELDLSSSELNHDQVLIKLTATGAADNSILIRLKNVDIEDIALSSEITTAQADLDILTGSDGVILATSQPNYVPATAAALTTHDGKLDIAQSDLDIITGSDGATVSSASVDAVWDELMAGHTTGGSFGKALRIHLDSIVISDGTAVTGSSSTITLNGGASSVDDYYNGSIVMITAGIGIGQSPKTISDYNGTTKVATIHGSWITTPDNTSDYAILGITGNAVSLEAQAKADVNAEVDDVISIDINTELTSVPTTASTLRQHLQFLFTYFRNRKTVTSAVETLYREDAATPLGTSALTDDGTTFTKGEMG